jgi:hypothetical protein
MNERIQKMLLGWIWADSLRRFNLTYNTPDCKQNRNEDTNLEDIQGFNPRFKTRIELGLGKHNFNSIVDRFCIKCESSKEMSSSE